MKNENLKQRNENEVTDRARVQKLGFVPVFHFPVPRFGSIPKVCISCIFFAQCCVFIFFFSKPFHILTKFRLCAQQNYDFHKLNLTRKPLAERGQQFGLEIDSHFSEQTACWQPQR